MCTPTPQQELDQEIADAWAEWGAEKEELLAALRRLERQLLLKDAVIGALVPPEDAARTLRRAVWDEDAEAWSVPRPGAGGGDQGGDDEEAAATLALLQARPAATPGAPRPVSALARAAAAAGDMDPRFRFENILLMELDLPDRVTFDLPDCAGAPPDPDHQAALDAMFDWGRHSLLVFAPPGAPGPLHFGAPPEAGAGAGGGGSGGGSGARPASAARGGRPPSAARGVGGGARSTKG